MMGANPQLEMFEDELQKMRQRIEDLQREATSRRNNH